MADQRDADRASRRPATGRETSVVIAVSGGHRESAFEACRWLIDELKRSVPIWKKEVYTEGEAWIDDRPWSQVSRALSRCSD
ncbi:MAG TPA: molybdenum cofactor biosynthesis protein MoaE [Candidatus Dormibacteraeota bacterium]